MEIARIYPEHFGMRGLSDHSYYPLQFEIIDKLFKTGAQTINPL